MLDQTPKKPKADSRRKGAAFEREIAKELFLLTGVGFKRNLSQYQQSGDFDLTPTDDAWPFAIECKRRADGWDCMDAWKSQADTAAAKVGKFPAVIFRYDNKPVRCCVPYAAISASVSMHPGLLDEWVTLRLPAFASLAAELMAARAEVSH